MRFSKILLTYGAMCDKGKRFHCLRRHQAFALAYYLYRTARDEKEKVSQRNIVLPSPYSYFRLASWGFFHGNRWFHETRLYYHQRIFILFHKLSCILQQNSK